MRMDLETRARRLLARNDRELNEVKRITSNEIYHSMKKLDAEYFYSKNGWCGEDAGTRLMKFDYMDKIVEVDIRVID